VIGVLLALNLSDLVSYLEGLFGFYIFDPSVFYITGLPSDLQLNDVVAIIFLSIILSALFCLYPAFRASSIKPIEAMRV
jgi:lipoprotein-releasing system permease protein